MSERRQTKRRPLPALVPIYHSDTAAYVGLLADISTTGLLIYTDTEIHTDAELSLEIRHPDLAYALLSDPVPDQSLVFAAASRWSETNGTCYRTGMRFTHIDSPTLRAIRRLICTLLVNYDSIRLLREHQWNQRSWLLCERGVQASTLEARPHAASNHTYATKTPNR